MKAAGAIALSLLLPAAMSPSPVRRSPVVFTDITSSAGILWKQVSGASVRHFLPETMGGGVGFLDFDHDGLQDIFLVTGGETGNHAGDGPARNALYHNLGNGRFAEVAQKAGVDRNAFYGIGVAAADYDNDNFPDLYVTGYPRSALWHNNRDGTFTDVTDKAGVANAGKFGASAAWFDFDRDGLLDLFVCNYVNFPMTFRWPAASRVHRPTVPRKPTREMSRPYTTTTATEPLRMLPPGPASLIWPGAHWGLLLST